MSTFQKIILALLFFALVAAVVRWKRPLWWAKLTKKKDSSAKPESLGAKTTLTPREPGDLNL